MLTMLAEENRQLAAEIVKLIEKRIYEVNSFASCTYSIKMNKLILQSELYI